MDDTFGLRQQPKKKKASKARRGDGFFEAFSDIADSIGKSVKTDLLGGTAKNIHDQLIGSAKSKTPPTETPDFDFSEWMDAREEEMEEEARLRGREEERAFQNVKQSEKLIYSLSDEKLKREIEAVRQDLKLLIAEMGKAEKQIESAVMQQVVDPGVYHLNFFEKLRSWLVFMRKSLQEGELWMEMWHTRSKQGAYWKGVKKSGTKFMLSQERYMATQAG